MSKTIRMEVKRPKLRIPISSRPPKVQAKKIRIPEVPFDQYVCQICANTYFLDPMDEDTGLCMDCDREDEMLAIAYGLDY